MHRKPPTSFCIFWKPTAQIGGSRGGGSGEQFNFFSKKPYRGGNQFLLGLSGKPVGAWGTYRQFSQAGHQVAKGEKSTPIFFYKPYAIRDRETDEEKQIMLVKSYNVFHTSQLTNPIEIKRETKTGN